MRRLLLAFALFAAQVGFGFNFQSELTVEGYSGSSTLSCFPVLLRLSEGNPSGFSYGDMLENGTDMEFRSPDGQTVYRHEIDTWNTNGESLVWIRVPELSGSSTKILFRYGDTTKTTAADGKYVWVGANGGSYAGVWHFWETIATAADARTTASADSAKFSDDVPMDATPTNRSMTASNPQAASFGEMLSVAGVIGNGRSNATQLKSQWTSYVVNDYSSFNLGGTFTFSGWIRHNGSTTEQIGWPVLFGRRTDPNYNDEPGWHVGNPKAVDALNMVGAYGQAYRVAVPDVTASGWLHVVFVYDGTVGYAYTNGVLVGSNTFKTNNVPVAVEDNHVKLAFGGSPFSITSVASFNGSFDELRLLSTAVSADWAKAEYDAAANASFVTAAAVGPVPDVLTITSTEGEVGTVSPAYGLQENLTGGQTIELRVSEAEQESSETLHYKFTGWKLYLLQNGNWVESDCGEGTSYDYVHTSGNTAKFVWQVTRRHPLELAADPAAGATFTVNGAAAIAGTNWVDEGTAQVVSSLAENYVFSRWTGDAAGQGSTTISLDMSADEAKSATIVLEYVDPHHEPEEFSWTGESGDWFDTSNWDRGKLPVTGDHVYLTNNWGKTVRLGAPTPKLGKLVVDCNNGKMYLFCSNWNTRVWADEIVVGAKGVITVPTAKSNTAVLLDSSTETNRIWLSGTTLTIEQGGMLDANSAGWASGNGPCWQGKSESYQGIGAHGGWYDHPSTSNNGFPYDSAEFPELPGCGAGSSSHTGGGGGAIRLDFSGTVTIDGEVRADCLYGAGYGFGSGGSVLLTCASVCGEGLVTARGAQSPSGNVHAGGGGRIAVHYTPSVQSNVTCGVVFSAAGGVGNPSGNGEFPYWESSIRTWSCCSTESGDGIFLSTPGTIWFPDNQFLTLAKHRACGWNSTGVWTSPEPLESITVDEDLTVNNARLVLPPNLDLTFGGNLTVTGEAWYARHMYALRLTNSTVRVKGDLALAGARLELVGGTLTVDGNVRQTKCGYAYGSWDASSGVAWAYDGGELWVKAANTNGPNQAGALVTVKGKWTLEDHAVVRPVASPNGAPVKLVARSMEIAEGALVNAQCAGYPPNCGSGSQKVLDEYHPTTPAEGGGTWGAGNLGGGVAWLEIDRELKLNGRIIADGNQYHAHRYQSSVCGGSVYVRARYLTGTTGSISARGGIGQLDSAFTRKAQDGGHIAIWTRKVEWPQEQIDLVNTNGVKGGFYVGTGTEPSTPPADGTVHWCHVMPPGFTLLVR